MHIVEPKIYLVSKPQIVWDELHTYLEDIGASVAWRDDTWLADRQYIEHMDGQTLIEIMGRLCYKSWEPGLNPNVTRIRDDQAVYLGNVIESRHGSVTAHANFSFILSGVSRVFTHELLRHMAGTRANENGDLSENISQESLRFVRVHDLSFMMPEVFDDTDRQMISATVMYIEQLAKVLIDKYQLDDPKLPFARKKQVTSAIRYIYPQGMTTDLGWTCNIRALRHVIESRTARGAEPEIRRVFGMVAERIREEAPALFADYVVNDAGEWITGNPKI